MKFIYLDLHFFVMPFCIGMVVAFLTSRRESINHSGEVTASQCVWRGYTKGVLYSIVSGVMLTLIVALVTEFNPFRDLTLIYLLLEVFLMYMILSPLLGFILYLSCGLMGYNLGNRKRVEAEIFSAQKQTIEDRD